MSDIRGNILWWAAKKRVRKYNPLVIAVGGAIAKTSTKNAIGQVLESAYPNQVLIGYGNLNSYLGVPLSILGFEIDFYKQKIGSLAWLKILLSSIWRGLFRKLPRYLVLEYGTDQPGDVEKISRQLPPQIGAITIVGPAHLGNYPSVEEMVKDEGYLAERTRDMLLVNSSDQYLTKHHARTKAKVVNVVTPLEEIAVNYAKKLATELKIDPLKIERALDEYKAPEHRFNTIEVNGYHLLDDSYNASPLAVQAALHRLKKMPSPRVAILGSMKELGETSPEFHKEVGRYARKYADKIIAVGEEAKEYEADQWFATSTEAAEKVFDYLPEGASILVKGSKSVHMENVVNSINTPAHQTSSAQKDFWENKKDTTNK